MRGGEVMADPLSGGQGSRNSSGPFVVDRTGSQSWPQVRAGLCTFVFLHLKHDGGGGSGDFGPCFILSPECHCCCRLCGQKLALEFSSECSLLLF